MSELNSKYDFTNPNIFNQKLFRREDDMLNVFRTAEDSHDEFWDFSSKLGESNDYNWDDKNKEIIYNQSSPDPETTKEFDFFNFASEPFGATDNLVSSPSIWDTPKRDEEYGIALKESKDKDNKSSSFVTNTSKDLFTNSNSASSGLSEAKLVTNFTQQESWLDESEKESELAGSKKKSKTFSRRKDVIIKTLLRKCRKYYLKDFNKRSNYLKTIKRKFGSSIYKTLLEDYLTKVFKTSSNEHLLIFMGVFLYQKDLEDNLDLFVSPNYGPAEIKKLINTVHEILYKYSHQKFHYFSKNEEFKYVFLHFAELGTKDLMRDKEYAAGFEIIRDQL